MKYTVKELIYAALVEPGVYFLPYSDSGDLMRMRVALEADLIREGVTVDAGNYEFVLPKLGTKIHFGVPPGIKVPDKYMVSLMTTENKKAKVSFEEFLDASSKIELTYGRIKSAVRVEKSKKLLLLQVQFEPMASADKCVQVVTNIGDIYDPDSLFDQCCLFVTNLEPTKIMGLDSYAMIAPFQMHDGRLSFVPWEGYKVL